jgi:hypothetical protein
MKSCLPFDNINNSISGFKDWVIGHDLVDEKELC